MQLKSITIRNFKAYKGPQRIPLKPITLIFGPNSAGKSSIVHALAFLKHVHLKNGDCSPNEVDLVWDKVSLGGWQNLLHGHDANQSMSLGLGDIHWDFSTVDMIPTVTDCTIGANGKSALSAKNNVPGKLAWQMTFGETHPLLLENYDCHTFIFHDGELVPGPDLDPDRLPHGFIANAWLHLTNWRGNKATPSKQLSSGEVFDWAFFNAAFKEHLLAHRPIRAGGLLPSPKSMLILHSTGHFEDRGLVLDGFTDQAREALHEALNEGRDIEPHLSQYFEDCFETALGQFEIPDPGGSDFLEKFFSSHVHLGPSREAPPRDMDKQSLANNAQYGPWLDLLDSPDRRDQVNASLKRLELNYEIVTRWKETITYAPGVNVSPETEAPANVEFRDRQEQLAFKIKKEGTQVTLSHRDLGYGVSMLLPILTALHSPRFKLITIEQPELHIHPRQQAGLADELIAAALGRRTQVDAECPVENSKQLLIETHSEHLILRLLRRIRETTRGKLSQGKMPITPADIAVLYVEPGEEGSAVRELRVNDQGRFIDDWPNGFFEDRLDELI